MYASILGLIFFIEYYLYDMSKFSLTDSILSVLGGHAVTHWKLLEHYAQSSL